jgi:hypothetical protein
MLTSVLRHCGFRFNIKFVSYQFYFVITGKFSAFLVHNGRKALERYRLAISKNYAENNFAQEFLNFCPLLLYFFRSFFLNFKFSFLSIFIVFLVDKKFSNFKK